MRKARHFLTSRNLLGEGPRWHEGEQSLYWVDIENGQIHSYSSNQQEHKISDVGLPIGCLAFRKSGGLVLATSDGFAYWSDESGLEVIIDLLSHKEDVRFNDGSVGPFGRFWAGTMTPTGSENCLYRLDPDRSVHQMETGIAIANGIGWSPDKKTLYFTDSPQKVIYAYDFDPDTGEISNRRPWVHSDDEPGVPDGLTVDVEGCVWSSRWDGSKIQRYNSAGKLIEEFALPCPRPTSCTFGGRNLDVLFVTTASTGLSDIERNEYPTSGDLFQIETDTRGQGEYFFLG